MADDLSVVVGANIAGFMTGMTEVKDQIEGLASTVSGISSTFAGVGEALAAAFAVQKIEQFITGMAAIGEEAVKMSSILGMSTEAYSAFAASMTALGVDTGAATRSFQFMERSIANAIKGAGPARDAFQNIGLGMNQVKAGSQNLQGFLDTLRQKWQGLNADFAREDAFRTILGRSFQEVLPYLNATAEQFARVQAAGDETGTTLKDNVAEGMVDTGISANILGLAIKGVGITIFEEFKPAIDAVIGALTDLVEGFNNSITVGGDLHLALRVVAGTFGLLFEVVDLFVTGFKILFQGLALALQVFWQDLKKTGSLAYDVFTLNWSQFQADWASGADGLRSVLQERLNNMLGDFESFRQRASAVLAQIAFDNVGNPAAKGPSGPKPSAGLAKTTGGGGSDRVAQWRDELEQQKEATGNYLADTTAMELSFWENIKATQALNSKEMIAVDGNIFQLRKKQAQDWVENYIADIREKQAAEKSSYASVAADEQALVDKLGELYGTDSKQYANELRHQIGLKRQNDEMMAQIELEHGKAESDIRKMGLQQEKDVLQEAVTSGASTNNQKYDQLRDLTAKMYQEDLQQLQNEMQVKNQLPSYYAKLSDQIETTQAKQSLDLEKINMQQAQAQEEMWKGYLDTVSSYMDTYIGDIMGKTEGMSQRLNEFWQDMATDFIKAVAKMILEWTAFEALGIGQNPLGSGKGIGGLIGALGSGMGLLGGGGGGAGGSAASMTALTAAITGNTASTAGNTASTTTNTGGMFQWIAATFTSIAQWLGLTTATTSATVATTSQAAATIPLVPAILALNLSIDFLSTLITQLIAAEYTAAVLSAVPMASGAWDVDADTLALIHAGEQVVPKDYASGLRENMSSLGVSRGADSSPASGARPGQGMSVAIQANDAKSFLSMVNDPNILTHLAKRLQTLQSRSPSLRK